MAKRKGAFELRESAPPSTVDANYLPIHSVATKTLMAYFPRENAPSSEHYQVASMNLEAAKDESEEDPMQIGMFLLAQIACVIPYLKGKLEGILRDEGFEILWATVPDQEMGFVIPEEKADIREQVVYMSLTILYLNKNINQENYDNYTLARSTALCSHCTLGSQFGPKVSLFRDWQGANRFRDTMGASGSMRKLMLNVVKNIAGRDTVMGRLFGYVYNILSWTEMSGLMFIVETLLFTRSPVIFSHHVAGEVVQLRNAIDAVINSAYPQFFRIECTQFERTLLDRNRFSMLLKVSQKIRENTSIATKRFVKPKNASDAIVEALVTEHRNHMLEVNKGRSSMVPTINRLTIPHDATDEEVSFIINSQA